MIGKTISHYKILAKLGQGGMGVVYKAKDTKLDRTVALKFLAPHVVGGDEEQSRLIREAKSAAALNHPNICTIHEIDKAEGRTFIAMEWIEGQSLKGRIESGPMAPDEAIDIAIQVAGGLGQAHEKGIIHRDIKPANIMVTRAGQAKIMDFGLAKSLGGTLLTQTGTTIGTVAYMSPEQARGAEVDARTDIWSLGAVLYEMVTGERPFKGDYEQAVIYQILNEKPKSVTEMRSAAPRDLERVIGRALARNRNERYRSAEDFKKDLESLRRNRGSRSEGTKATSEEARPSIAVLPFRDMSSGRDQDYFCEGIAEELINALVKLEGLRVASRTSTFQFKDRESDIKKIGAQLEVQTVLEGSIRKSGDRLRITAQLINVEDGFHIWSEKYDRDLEDIFAIQDEISLAIVDKLKVRLLGDEKAGVLKRHTDDIEAHDLCLKGLYYSRMLTVAGYDTAVKCLEQAIQKDPDYALAFGGLALVYFSRTYWGYMPPQEGYPKSRAYAKKAVELDSTIGEPHAMLGYNSTFYEWDWTSAEREFKQALDLAPKSSVVHTLYSDFLTITSRHEEAVTEAELALELDPLSEYVNANLGLKLWFSERYDEAMEPLQKALKLNPNHFYPHLVLSYAYASKEMYKEATAEIERAVDLSGEHPWAVSILALNLHQVGQESQSEELFSRLLERSKKEYVPPMCFVNASIACGDLDRAYDWVRRACELRDSFLCWVRVAPSKAVGIPDEPRFTELLRTMGPGSR